MYYRQTYLQANTDAIIHNLRAVKYRSGKEVIGVIKADGYGIGALEMARLLVQNDIAMLAVSSLDEGIYLRKNNIKKDILILGYTDPRFICDAVKYNVVLTVTSLEWVKKISSLDTANLRVHIKANTKMNRLGINNLEDWQTALVLLRKLKVKVEGAFTHYACSDSDDQIITQKQYDDFKYLIDNSNYNFKWIHIANSDAAISFKNDHISNCVRVGIALVGYAKYHDDLLPSLALYSKVTNVTYLQAGECVSYGCTYTAKESEFVATLAIGYADGFTRKNQGRKVYINNDFAEIVGRICMDQCMIKVNSEPKIDDLIEIFGPHISLENMAKELDTVIYEIITTISDRVTRVYTHKGKVINSRLPRFK